MPIKLVGTEDFTLHKEFGKFLPVYACGEEHLLETEKLKAKMEKRGISIVSVTDGDPDHMPIKKRRMLKRKERRMHKKLTDLNKKRKKK